MRGKLWWVDLLLLGSDLWSDSVLSRKFRVAVRRISSFCVSERKKVFLSEKIRHYATVLDRDLWRDTMRTQELT
jgi:hypothetical protein